MPFHRPVWFVLNFQNAAGEIIVHLASATNSTVTMDTSRREVAEVRYCNVFAIQCPHVEKITVFGYNPFTPNKSKLITASTSVHVARTVQ
jgi:hypothetical protein